MSKHVARARARALGTTFLTTLALVAGALPAQAGVETTTFTYTGTNHDHQLLFDTGLMFISGCDNVSDNPATCFPDGFPGTAWFRVRAGVHTTIVDAQSATFTLDAPDSFRAGSSVNLITKLEAIDAPGKEIVVTTTPYVQFDVAYDEPWADCSNPHEIPDLSTLMALPNGNPDGCIDIVGHSGEIDIATVEILARDTTLPYSGTRNLSQTSSSPTLDVGALVGLPGGLLGARLDFETLMALTATTGYTATRRLSDGGGVLGTTPLHWSGPTQHADTAALPCTAQVGDSLGYSLTDLRWSGTGDVTGDLSLVVEIIDPIPDPSFPIASVDLFHASVLGAAPDFSRNLGTIHAENSPPTVALAPITSGTEGSPVALSIVGTGPGGSFDNCDPSGSSLSVTWNFDDGTSAYGKNVQHTWTDGPGTRSGEVIVTDQAGNRRTLNFSVHIANVAPTVSIGPDRQVDWGVTTSFTANGADAGAVDRQSLAYAWDFGDTTDPGGATGRSASYTYSRPGIYTVTGHVWDKDGASASDTLDVTVTRRDTTFAYTGPTTGKRDKTVAFTADVIDEYGRPVVGRTVTLEVGPLTATGVTDSTGHVVISLRLKMTKGTHQMRMTYAGDSLYHASGYGPISFPIT